MHSEKIRNTFLDFFKSKNHFIIPSYPIVRKNDPSLLFTNAGMNYFKDIFYGIEKPTYSRVANSQKCLRVSGKHNDLKEVGYDNNHHTMFEMLGNWSFCDYSKEDAIKWAFELLVDVYKIPKNMLYVTIFQGNDFYGLKKDIESFNIWNKLLNVNNILFSSKHNFWEMGDTGPCGVSTEIHVDLRSGIEKKTINGRYLINTNNNDVIEIWNIVFIEYFKNHNNVLTKLSNKYIDTGIGFERLCRILQLKSSNYDTDLFKPIINNIENITKINYGVCNKKDISIRIISDHFRAVLFAISDGQNPSNTGSGYVVRRILRRSVSYYYRFMSYKKPLLYKLVDNFIQQMQNVFPELANQNILLKKMIKKEEQIFLKTINLGIKKIKKIIINIKKKNGKIINGHHLFKLYDTYGFPLDISYVFAAENNLSIDEKGFILKMNEQKQRSKKFKK